MIDLARSSSRNVAQSGPDLQQAPERFLTVFARTLEASEACYRIQWVHLTVPPVAATKEAQRIQAHDSGDLRT